jgi:hypothetical protein
VGGLFGELATRASTPWRSILGGSPGCFGLASPSGMLADQYQDPATYTKKTQHSLRIPLVIRGEDEIGEGLLQLQSKGKIGHATGASGSRKAQASKPAGKRKGRTSQSGEGRKGARQAKSVRNGDEADVKYIAFQRQRKDVGSIALTQHGLKLSSSAGDFAEWHAQIDPNDHFQAGDVVGLVDSKVTFVTTRATMAGIITKKAVVVGSTPTASSISHDLETGTAESRPVRPVGQEVAYCGRVPVRVSGVCFAGDALTASGLNDGTAVPIRAVDSELSTSCQSNSECGKCIRQTMSYCWPMRPRIALVVGVAMHDSIGAHADDATTGASTPDQLTCQIRLSISRCPLLHRHLRTRAHLGSTDPQISALLVSGQIESA